MNTYKFRNRFQLQRYNTSITREAFESSFYRTPESVTFTFNGWDGKSYDGDARTARVWHTNLEGNEADEFVKVGKALFYIDRERQVREKSTGIKHPTAWWLMDVERRS